MQEQQSTRNMPHDFCYRPNTPQQQAFSLAFLSSQRLGRLLLNETLAAITVSTIALRNLPHDPDSMDRTGPRTP